MKRRIKLDLPNPGSVLEKSTILGNNNKEKNVDTKCFGF